MKERDGAMGGTMGEPMNKKLIYLVGMMGTGKSTVGRCLAEQMGGSFIDLDQYIEEREQSSIAEIFQNCGEAYFRDLESSVIQEVANNCPQASPYVVVATGGGAFERSENRRIINDSGIAVWLRTKPETMAARLADDTSRPLLHGETEQSLLNKITQLLERRSTNYQQAEIHLDTDGKSAADICNELIRMLDEHNM